ncbi:MAG TPA: VOC family protein [Solirubrobacteraceae bacterium]|nr:VOC family protein [Solirubrobacteraceae bacterium]
MITGAHTIIYSPDAERMRSFFAEALEFPSVDAGGGWLIFALPPAELAVHPAEDTAGRHELYLMCDDLQETVQELERRGVELSRPIREERWGVVTAIRLPDGGEVGLYEPRHPTPSR